VRVAQPSPDNPLDYLQSIFRVALTIPGRDRARGRVVQVSLPDPSEDDGRLIRGSTLEDIAKIIGAAYTPHQVVRFMHESGLSLEQLGQPNTTESWPIANHVLDELAEGTSGQRRELRAFLGAWLDDGLHSGPSEDQRKAIERDLARQGWFVQDGRLVVGEPVRGVDRTSPSGSPDRMHPKVWQAASPQWAAGHRQDAILEAAKAVNSILQSKIDRTDVSGVKLVQEAFSSNPAVAGKPRLRYPTIPDRETRESKTQGALSFGIGCFQAIRNPAGHVPSDQHDLTEQAAMEQLSAWSLLARWIDEAEVDRA
jgi:uncharacterized protein (TIGR02391 family)